MSSTPIYDELAATYLADLTPDPREPVAPVPTGKTAQQTPAPAARTKPPTEPRKRPKA
ncbi:hypothetical protein [Saccharothrix sp. NRRL B-16314]|uniref:hypothetical protein n=1 Tax=Saccharothrix sp. NRRL B-16314 TaxID=1463825 RepID=UPI000B05B623|nr:hypothetical protein [Saccharothrix sp. NRRL B-16314]